jgi:hypothetical protein
MKEYLFRVLGMVPFIQVPSLNWCVGDGSIHSRTIMNWKLEWVASYDMDPMLIALDESIIWCPLCDIDPMLIVVVVVVENSQLVSVSLYMYPLPYPQKHTEKWNKQW